MRTLDSKIRSKVESPAFVFSAPEINDAITTLRRGLHGYRARILYAIKACNAEPVLETLRGLVDGFAVASPAEARIASNVLGDVDGLHITTPGLRYEWFEVFTRVTHVAFNSIFQCERLQGSIPSSVSMGIRINPGRSIVVDQRYDPGRRHSKLGVPMSDFGTWMMSGVAPSVKGLHFHNACLCRSWIPLLETVSEITARFGPMLSELDWINLGGGYIWDENSDFGPLQEAVDLLTTKYGTQVFIEPGAGIVNSAGYLVASVIDLFKSDGKSIAVLDTTVNHLPEVFEYQYEPDVVEHEEDARHEYILAGCTCLAGDLFGEYSFREPLEVGSRVTFANVGAYSLVKAHMFNGINLPNIYALTEEGELVLKKRFSYEDFASRCGAETHAVI